MDKQTVQYRAQGAQNGIETLIIGGFGLVFIMLFNLLRPNEITGVEILLVSLCIAAIFIGFLKTQEPYYSVQLSETELIYFHKYGRWQVEHHNFNRCGVPKTAEGLELNAVGIQLRDVDDFLAHISPRIAGKILIEQRNLFLQLVQKNCKTGNCPSEWLIEETQYTSASGFKCSGLLAMFANRTTLLRQFTGYDLLLPASALDTDIWHVCMRFNEWKRDPERFIKLNGKQQ